MNENPQQPNAMPSSLGPSSSYQQPMQQPTHVYAGQQAQPPPSQQFYVPTSTQLPVQQMAPYYGQQQYAPGMYPPPYIQYPGPQFIMPQSKNTFIYSLFLIFLLFRCNAKLRPSICPAVYSTNAD